jgi:hypothetical protein
LKGDPTVLVTTWTSAGADVGEIPSAMIFSSPFGGLGQIE